MSEVGNFVKTRAFPATAVESWQRSSFDVLTSDDAARRVGAHSGGGKASVAGMEEIRRWRESGQSATNYCRERGIHAGTLAGWLSKVRETGGAGTGARVDDRSVFVPVRVSPVRTAAPSSAEHSDIEVVLRNGRRVRVRGNFDNGSLARLLMVVEGGASC